MSESDGYRIVTPAEWEELIRWNDNYKYGVATSTRRENNYMLECEKLWLEKKIE